MQRYRSHLLLARLRQKATGLTRLTGLVVGLLIASAVVFTTDTGTTVGQEPVAKAAVVVPGGGDRYRVMDTTVVPWRMTAKLSWDCTGFLINARVVLTAGHCSVIGFPVTVSPGLNKAAMPPGVTPVTVTAANGAIRTASCFVDASTTPECDYGAIILKGSTLGTQVGAFFSVTDAAAPALQVDVSGYPGDQQANTMWSMGKTNATADKTVIAVHATKPLLAYKIDTAGGQSGSPVWDQVGGTYRVLGIHTGGYRAVSPLTQCPAYVGLPNNTKCNEAVRLTPAVMAEINGWVAVGGIVDKIPDSVGARLEGSDSGSNGGVLAGVVAGAVAVGAVALGGAAWYARRRWLS